MGLDDNTPPEGFQGIVPVEAFRQARVAAAAQQFRAHLDVCWIHTHRGELVFTSFVAQLGDLIRSGIWLENGVIDHPGNTRILRDATQG